MHVEEKVVSISEGSMESEGGVVEGSGWVSSGGMLGSMMVGEDVLRAVARDGKDLAQDMRTTLISIDDGG